MVGAVEVRRVVGVGRGWCRDGWLLLGVGGVGTGGGCWAWVV